MAEAHTEHRSKTRTVTVQEEVVILTLDEDEARTLATILDRIGGSQETPRRFTDRVSAALADAGVLPDYAADFQVNYSSIYFAEPETA